MYTYKVVAYLFTTLIPWSGAHGHDDEAGFDDPRLIRKVLIHVRKVLIRKKVVVLTE